LIEVDASREKPEAVFQRIRAELKDLVSFQGAGSKDAVRR
jgi:hypothetical protein